MKKAEPRTRTHVGARIGLWIVLVLATINAAFIAAILVQGAANAFTKL